VGCGRVGGGGWVWGYRGAESWHQRQGTLSAIKALEVTCQGFLQLVSVVCALQQASQGNDDVFKAWPLGSVLTPTVLKNRHKSKMSWAYLHVKKCMCACVCNLRAYWNDGTGCGDT